MIDFGKKNAPRLFSSFDPYKSFNSNNLDNVFIDSSSNPILSPQEGYQYELADYFCKGLECYKSVEKFMIYFLSFYTDEKELDFTNGGLDAIYNILDQLIKSTAQDFDKQGIRFIEPDGTTLNHVAYIDSLDEIFPEDIPLKYSLIHEVFSRGNMNPQFDEVVFAFSALLSLDQIVYDALNEKSALTATTNFYNSYYSSVGLDNLIKTVAKRNTQSATTERVDRTNLRNKFAADLWIESGKPLREFSFSPESLEAINQYSETIRKTPLTPHGGGETIYRALLKSRK